MQKIRPITVAILAQGTHWAVAISQAFFNFEALIDHAVLIYLSKLVTYLFDSKRFSLAAIPCRMHRISSDLRS